MNEHDHRAIVAHAAADALVDARERLASARAVIGFDGFIDSIIHVVDVRHGPGRYERMTRMTQLSDRIAAAAGRSANIEFAVTRRKLGGNAAIMAQALSAVGMPITFIGAIGSDEGGVHEVFEPFAHGCEQVIVTGPPGLTDAVEFDDGKILFGKITMLEGLDYSCVRRVAGLSTLRDVVGRSSLLATVNWTMLPGMSGIWRGMMDEVLPGLGDPSIGPRRMFVDLADPAKRTATDLQEAIVLLREMNGLCPLTLGLNLAEAGQVARIAGLADAFAAGDAVDGEHIREAACALRQQLDIDTVVIHPREGAAAADADGQCAWFDGPFTPEPKISTGGGDHFNAGVALARLASLPIEQAIAVGTAVSGYYIRNAASPTLDELAGFLRNLPPSR
ncbi:MAG: hypothetical protein KAS72_10950 [Phycisphaerales bacterium]|nr:hypothetical protein [Phycisphaerales bacterium]